LASSWCSQRFSDYKRLAGRSYKKLFELTAADQEVYLVLRSPHKFWVSQTILGYDNATTNPDGHSANYDGAQAMNNLWGPAYRHWYHGKRWDGTTNVAVPRPNILLLDYSGFFDTFPADCSNLIKEGVIPIFRHNAKQPDRYYYDTQIPNNFGWTAGVLAWKAFEYQVPGSIPIYRHNAKQPDRYYYDTQVANNSGWSQGVLAFYAFETPQPNTIPIYRHEAPNPERYLYDTEKANNTGWSEGVVAFYVPV